MNIAAYKMGYKVGNFVGALFKVVTICIVAMWLWQTIFPTAPPTPQSIGKMVFIEIVLPSKSVPSKEPQTTGSAVIEDCPTTGTALLFLDKRGQYARRTDRTETEIPITE